MTLWLPGTSFKFLLLSVDITVLVGAASLAHMMRFGAFSQGLFAASGFWFLIAISASCLYLMGGYDFRLQRIRSSVLPTTLLMAALVLGLAVTINYLLAKDRAGLFGRGVLVGATVAFGAWFALSRALIRAFQRRVADRIRFHFCVEGTYVDELRKDLQPLHLEVSIHAAEQGCTHDRPAYAPLFVQERLLANNGHDAAKLATARLYGEPIGGLSEFYEMYLGKLPVASLGPEWFIVADGFDLSRRSAYLRLKRLGDIALALPLSIVILPFLLLAMIAIRLESPGSSLYSQVRTGLRGQAFTIYKLRTMRSDAEKTGAQWAAKNDARITMVGRFLRKTRIDELPQLWNILRGDMSFVGPRPERPEFIGELSKQVPHYDFRHVVSPGVTGWAQIMYPYGASVEDARRKLEYDLYYIKHTGLLMDLRILFRTVRTVIMAGGR